MRKRVRKKRRNKQLIANKPRCLKELELDIDDYLIFNNGLQDECCVIKRGSISDYYNSYYVERICFLDNINESLIAIRHNINDESWVRKFTKEEWEKFMYYIIK